MSKTKRHRSKVKSSESKMKRQTEVELDNEENKELEQLPCVEWGERIDTGKIIARGGKDSGYVPGAFPSK